MEMEQDIDDVLEEHVQGHAKETCMELLVVLKKHYQAYLDEEVGDEQLSDATIYWVAQLEHLSDSLFAFEPSLKSLKNTMDVTHPDFSREKKEAIVKDALRKVNEILGV